MASLSLLLFKYRYFLGANASHSRSLLLFSLSSSSFSLRPVSFRLSFELVLVRARTGVEEACEDDPERVVDARARQRGLSCDELDSASEASRGMEDELEPEMRRARRNRSLRAMVVDGVSFPEVVLLRCGGRRRVYYCIWISVFLLFLFTL